MDFIFEVATAIGQFLLTLSGIFAGITGSFLNTVLYFTVINMGWFVSHLGVGNENAIVVVWTLVRDFVNLLLIFGIVYVGALLVLGIRQLQYLRTIAYILIAAILVNFSLFFTKLVIEVANMFSAELYYATIDANPKDCSAGKADGLLAAMRNLWQCAGQGYSGAFMSRLRLAGLFADSEEKKDSKAAAAIFLGGSVLLVVLGVIFLAAGLLLLVRFIYLVALMILSPFAFVAWAIPSLEQYARLWWSKLVGESFFAPVLLFGLWATLLLVDKMSFLVQSNSAYDDAFLGTSSAGYAILFFFAVTIGLAWGSLAIAKKFSASFSDQQFGGAKVHQWLQKNKWRVMGATLGFSWLGGSVAGAALGAAAPRVLRAARAPVYPLQAIGRKGVGTVGKKLMDKGKEKMQEFERKSIALRSDKRLSRRLLGRVYEGLGVPVAHFAGEVGQVLYTGQGEKAGPVLKWLAKMGLKQPLSEYERDVQRVMKESIVELAKRKPPKEIQEQAERREAEVVQAQKERNVIEEQEKKVAEELTKEQSKPESERDEQRIAALLRQRDNLERELRVAGKLQQQLNALPANLRDELQKVFQDQRMRNVLGRAMMKWQKGAELNDAEKEAISLLSRKSAYVALQSSASQLLQDSSLDETTKQAISKHLNTVQELRHTRGENDPFYRLALQEAVKAVRSVKPSVIQERLTKADEEWLARDAFDAFDAAYVEPVRRDAVNDALRLATLLKTQPGTLFYRKEINSEAAKQAIEEIRKVAAGKLTTQEEVQRLLQAITQAAESGAVETTGPESGPSAFAHGVTPPHRS